MFFRYIQTLGSQDERVVVVAADIEWSANLHHLTDIGLPAINEGFWKLKLSCSKGVVSREK